jgi:hypothetical protein
MAEDNSPRPPITDSPWFWAYLFGVTALVGALLMNSKFDARQAQHDGNFARRTNLLEQQGAVVSQDEPQEETAEPQESRYIRFTPLYGALALGTIVAWVILWRKMFANTLAKKFV